MWGGIRIRLLLLVAGVAVPIAAVGLIEIWKLWEASRQQLDDSLDNQAEIAGAAFEQWIDAQREPLATVAARFAEHPTLDSDLAHAMQLSVATRSHWLGLRIINAAGETLLSELGDAPSLRPDIAAGLVHQLAGRDWTIDTDWSRGPSNGILMISRRLGEAAFLVAQIDVPATSESFLRRVKLAEQSVFSVFGPQKRILLYRNATAETHLGRDMSDSPLLIALGDKRTAVIELTSPIDGIRRAYGLGRAGDTGCVAVVGIPSESLYGPARSQLNQHLLVSGAGLLLAMLSAALIARRIARPIRRLSEAARRIGAGEYTARATFRTSGELEELRAAFNSTAAEIQKRETRLAELDRLKSDFVGGVSHEMRTPLTTIKTLTSVLLRGAGEAERADYLKTIMAECDRQIDLVLNLLDLSQIEAGTFNVAVAPVDVAEVIRSCAKIERRNAEERGHRLEVRLPDGLPSILADRAALRRVLCGLVQNAIKYTPDGGRITIEAAANADRVSISVSDNGCGIAEPDVPRIFEKFYRAHSVIAGWPVPADEGFASSPAPPGIGLGLYLARAVVEEIGGRIEVSSRIGEGSVFTLVLPVWENIGEAEGQAPDV